MILHITRRVDWDEAVRKGAYAPASLDAEGFIHCSTFEQTVDTANEFFRGQSDLVLLCIDESRLTAPLEYEAPASEHDRRRNLRFPHLYGPLNLDAVTNVVAFPCDADGSFRMLSLSSPRRKPLP